MREDVTIRKAQTAIGKALRAAIKGTAMAYEKRLPRKEARENFVASMLAVDAASQVAEEARKQKAERLKRHFAPQEDKPPKPELDRRGRRKARLARERQGPHPAETDD